ncbi:MAG TPA: hypothetical protein VFM18_05300 [Methanosarcina sp.]|nr:hypothetical protein [Methanosarcina sp.]
MNKYLEKIANTHQINYTDPGSVVGSMALGSAIGHAVTLPVTSHFGDKLEAQFRKTGQADSSTIKSFLRNNKLKTSFNVRDSVIDRKHGNSIQGKILRSMRRGGPAYEPSTDTVVGVRRHGRVINKDVIMHELGHAKDRSSFKTLKTLEGRLTRTSIGKLGTTAAVGAALYNKDTRDYAPAVAAVPGALVMRQEGMANYHAYKAIRNHKGAAAGKEFLKKIVKPNTFNYLSSVAAPVLGAYVAKRFLDSSSSPSHVEKKASHSMIQASHKGHLHKEMHVDKDKTIPMKDLHVALHNARAHHNNKLIKQIVFAENAKHWHHKNK